MTKAKDFFANVFQYWFRQSPSFLDAVCLSIFTILITINPYFADGKINLFEMGIYLPGIQGVLNGLIPYRDFFHLRGPFELYPPAFLMSIFGAHIKVLYSYFYFGNVLCLILCVWIARELLKTRFMLYIFLPVLIARTFPRVVFMIWGGMRYAWGLMAVLWIIKFFKTKRLSWIFWAGVTTAMALFTSVEMGVYLILGIGAVLMAALVLKTMDRVLVLKAAGVYALGCAVVAVPYVAYLASQQALIPYLDATVSVITNIQNTFDQHIVSIYPHDFKEALIAMTNFFHTNFKHMTPSYLYLILLGYVAWRLWRKSFDAVELCLLFLGVYGFIMYNTGFRGIWAAQFEMALMPEKILYFFILEIFLLMFLTGASSARWKKYAAYIFILALLGSSLGYAIQRYNHRFVAFKILRDTIAGKGTRHLQPLAKEESRTLTFERARGIVVPAQQASELEAIVHFLQTQTAPSDVIVTYPELGIYNFFADRPFLGRFPIATFAWMNDNWHREFVDQMKSGKIKYLILQKEMPKDWYQVYLGPEPNRVKYDEVMTFIQSEFVLKTETPLSSIYELKIQR